MVKRIDRTEKQIDFIVIGPFTDNNKIAKGADIALFSCNFSCRFCPLSPQRHIARIPLGRKITLLIFFLELIIILIFYTMAFCVDMASDIYFL